MEITEIKFLKKKIEMEGSDAIKLFFIHTELRERAKASKKEVRKCSS